MSRNRTVYSVWVCKHGRMKRYRFDNAVKGRRFARKTDGNVWGVTYERSTPSSRRAVEEHNYGAKHFRQNKREHRNARRRNAMAMRMSERDGMKVLDKDGHVVVDKGFFAFERYCNGRRKGTIL